MPHNNPSGVNGWEGFGSEPAYGTIKRLQEATAAAPLAGGSPALGAPKRAQRQAGRGQRPQQAMAAPPLEPPAPQPAMMAAQFFAATAHLGDLWAEYAARSG